MLVGDWLIGLFAVVIVYFCVLGVYVWYCSKIKKKEFTWCYVVILVSVLLALPSLGCVMGEYDYADKYAYVGDVGTSNCQPRCINDNNQIFSARSILPSSNCALTYEDLSYFGIKEKDLYEYNSFDRVCFKDKGNKLSLVQFIKGIKDKSIWLDVEIVSCTDYIIIKGSDINIVSDVHKHLDCRNMVYYDDKTYIKYKDIFYKLATKDFSWVQDDKEYVVVFDSLSKGKINNLEGTYDCYNICDVQGYEKEK